VGHNSQSISEAFSSATGKSSTSGTCENKTTVNVECEQRRAIYERCRSDLGRLWNGTVDTYGPLALAASPGDINRTDDDEAFMGYGVRSMCDGFGWIGTASQVCTSTLLLALF